MKKVYKIKKFSDESSSLQIQAKDLYTGDYIKLVEKYNTVRNKSIKKEYEYSQTRFEIDKDELSSDRNLKDKAKKLKEYFQFLNLSYQTEINYEILDFGKELFDAFMKIDNKKVGIEITQMVINEPFMDFYQTVSKFLKRFIVKNNFRISDFLLEIKLEQNQYHFNKQFFMSQLEDDLKKLINGTYKYTIGKNVILNYNFSDNNGIDIYVSNHPTVHMQIENQLIFEKVEKKENALLAKLNSEKQKCQQLLAVDEMWLLFYSEGKAYDDYLTIDEKALSQLQSSYYDKIIFINKKREFVYIIYLKDLENDIN